MNFDFKQHPIKWTTIVASVAISIVVGSLILILVSLHFPLHSDG